MQDNSSDIVISHNRQKAKWYDRKKNFSSAELLARRQKLPILVGATAFLLVIVIAVVCLIINKINSATIEVVVAPTDAQILIGENQVQNGTYRMQPGQYSVSISREGFVEYSGEIEAKADETTRLLVCLDTTDATVGWYDDPTSADYKACQQAIDTAISNAEQEWLNSDPVLRILPHHDYNAGYDIDYKTDADLNITLIITPLSCNKTRADLLYQAALDFLEGSNIDIDNYIIERRNSCE